MAKSRPPKVNRYSMEFKATAVRLSELPEVLIQDVAEALDIYPFLLSRWRKQAREGLIMTKGIKPDDESKAGNLTGPTSIGRDSFSKTEPRYTMRASQIKA